MKWQQFLVKEKIEQPNLSTPSDWLQPIAEAYEQLEQQNVEHPATHQVHFVQNSKTTTATYRQSHPKLLCPLKDGSHEIFKCEKFKKMSPEERHINVKALGLCLNCLSQNHLLKDCLSKSTCRVNNCNQRHNTLLHREKTAPKSNSLSFCNKQQARTNGEAEVFTRKVNCSAMVQVVPVTVHSLSQKQIVYALLDSGSTSSFMSPQLAKMLELLPMETSDVIIRRFNSQKNHST